MVPTSDIRIMAYSVGELAKRCGLTVRTLHHYESLGLLSPSARSEAGYRLYGEADVLRLHRILAFRQMGLPLKDIPPLLVADPPVPLLDLLERQQAAVRQEIDQQQRLLTMLDRVARRVRDGDGTLTDDLLALMSMQRMIERHYTPDDIAAMHSLQDGLSPQALETLKADTARLIAQARAALNAGLAPDSPEGLAMGRQWAAIAKAMPLDPSLQDKGRSMLAQEPELQQRSGVDLPLVHYIDQTIAAAAALDGDAA